MTLFQRCLDAGPPSATVAQHPDNVGQRHGVAGSLPAADWSALGRRESESRRGMGGG